MTLRHISHIVALKALQEIVLHGGAAILNVAAALDRWQQSHRH